MSRGPNETDKNEPASPDKGVLRLQFSYGNEEEKNLTAEDLATYKKAMRKRVLASLDEDAPAQPRDAATLKMMEDYAAGKPIELKRPVTVEQFEAILEAGEKRLEKDMAEGKVKLRDLFDVSGGKELEMFDELMDSPGFADKLMEAAERIDETAKAKPSAKPPKPPGGA